MFAISVSTRNTLSFTKNRSSFRKTLNVFITDKHFQVFYQTYLLKALWVGRMQFRFNINSIKHVQAMQYTDQTYPSSHFLFAKHRLSDKKSQYFAHSLFPFVYMFAAANLSSIYQLGTKQLDKEIN